MHPMQIFHKKTVLYYMYYKTEKNPRSRLASLGSETLNNSLAGSALSQNDPYTPIQPRKISQP